MWLQLQATKVYRLEARAAQSGTGAWSLRVLHTACVMVPRCALCCLCPSVSQDIHVLQGAKFTAVLQE